MQLLDTPLTADPQSADHKSRELALFLSLAQRLLSKAPELTAIENSADVNRFFYHGAGPLDEYQMIWPHEGAAALAWRIERYYTDVGTIIHELPETRPLRRYWNTAASLFVVRAGAFYVGCKELAQLAPFRANVAEHVETLIWQNGGRSLVHPIGHGAISGHEMLALETALQRDMPGLSAGVDLVNRKAPNERT